MEKVYPKVTAVDEHDNVIGYYDLFDALAAGHIRRIAAVFIFNERGELLLQKRTPDVLSPNTWDISAAGHVNEGENYLEAAQKEMREELRLTTELEEIATSLPVPGLFLGLFKGCLNSDTEINYNNEEVQAVRWISLTDLEEEMKTKPESFCTMGLVNVWNAYRDKILAA